MTILIAQLSDLHLNGTTDALLDRADAIGSAIAQESIDGVTEIVVVLGGDIAFSGHQIEYAAATTFLDRLKTGIITRCKPQLRYSLAVVPGNHDCNFPSDQAARDAALATITTDKAPPPSIVEAVMAPLDEYFRFSTSLGTQAHAICPASRFHCYVDIHEDQHTLRFHLINTAWMSSKKESPGTLHFPVENIRIPSKPADVTVAVLHHPLNWFSQPHSMRPLRDRLGDTVSLVLTAHEHTAEAYQHSRLEAQPNERRDLLFIASGALQEHLDASLCSFNTLMVNLTERLVQVTQHTYVHSGHPPYFQRKESKPHSILEPMGSAGPAGFSLRPDWLASLDDPGTPVHHPHRDPRIGVRLSEIFIYPDLWELDSEHDGADQRQIRSKNVEHEVLASARAIITGTDKSGRSAIAKRLFLAAFAAGRVPLLLLGDRIPRTVSQLRSRISEAVSHQYSNLSAEQFEQLEPSHKVILVDDVHRISINDEARTCALKHIESLAGTVILCGDDIIRLGLLRNPDIRSSGLWEYRHLVILSFGEYLRVEFVRKWLLLDESSALSDESLESETERICQLLNIILKKQLIPPHPLFLLLVLQQSDIAHASVQDGSFGKLFEGLTTALLAKSTFLRLNISDKHLYLASLAREMYDSRTMTLSIDHAKKWHRSYWDNVDVDIPFDILVADLDGVGIITRTDTEIRFRYMYFYCFFVAYNLDHLIHEDTTRSVVEQLTASLHHRVSAEIVLFLAHMTGDPVVLNAMMDRCGRLFQESTEATLQSDVEGLNSLIGPVECIVLPDQPAQNRTEHRLRQDDHVFDRIAASSSTVNVVPPEADNAIIKQVFDVTAAYKTIQILGQALRNVSGSASKERKEQIIEQIVSLSGRLLGVYLSALDDEKLPLVLEEMSNAHRDQNPSVASSGVHDQVCQQLHGLSQFVCFSVVKHTSASVHSENLSSTIARVLSTPGTFFRRSLALSFELDRLRAFPAKEAIHLYRSVDRNSFPASLVRNLIAYHCYLHTVDHDTRQSACDQLEIKLLPTIHDNRRKHYIS